MDYWTLQDAKNKFSQVVDVATSGGRPQFITKRGKNSAVVLSYEAYLRLTHPQKTVLSSLQPDEPSGVELDIERDRDMGRDFAL